MTPVTLGALDRIRRPLASLHLAGQATLAAGAVVAVFAAAAWAARLGAVRGAWWVVPAWTLAAVLLVVVLRGALRGARAFTRPGVAAALETHGAARAGAVMAFLSPPAAGTSDGLLRRADQDLAQRLEADGDAALVPVRTALRRSALRGGGLLLLAVAVLAAARPARAPSNLLFDPAGVWTAMASPIRLTAWRTEVDRGDSVRFTVEAPGAAAVTFRYREPGETWRTLTLAPGADGEATVTLGPLENDLFAFASRPGRSSDTTHVRVRIPAFLGPVSVTAQYPAYLGLEPEPLPLGADSIALPVGTRLVTRGSATLDLASAAWTGGGRRYAMQVDGSAFEGTFTPRGAGRYVLRLATASGAPLAGDSAELRLVLVPDLTPAVAIPVPGADTLAPASLRVPLVVDARDDYGLTALRVVSRRVSRLGMADEPVSLELTLSPGTPDQALAPAELRLDERNLLPGDTVRYWAEAVDNSPGRQIGRSREFVLRIPTLTELRDATRRASANLQTRLDSLVTASKAAERETEDLARERLRSESGARGNRNEPLSYQDAQRAQQVAEAQEEMLREAEDLQEALENLRQAAEEAGLDDPAFRARLDEIRDQLQRALTPEMRQRLEELQQALANLDAQRAEEALQRLAEMQKQLREALEQSRELFRRAALEGDLAAFEQEAEELTRQAREWAERQARADSARAANEAQAYANRADTLAAGLDRAADEVRQDSTQGGAADKLEEASQAARRAGQQMRQGGQQARSGNRQSARQRGENAAAEMEPVEEQVESAREDMAERWRDEVTQALDHTLAETSQLTDRQLAVERALRAGDETARVRADQGAVEDGTQRLVGKVRDAAGRNALISPRIAAALEGARREMERTRTMLSQGATDPRAAAEGAARATELLTAAAYQLLRSREQVAEAESGSGLSEAMEQMAEMAQQQGQLAQLSAGLLPMPLPGPGLDAQLQGLAARQRGLAQQLERMRGEGQLAGAGEFAREAEELARRLEAGRLDRQTVERQERLFRRMLDAGRTLEGEEKDEKKERQSETAKDQPPRLPAAVRERLEEGSELRMPTWEELQRLTPEERRLVVDYFRRLAVSGP